MSATNSVSIRVGVGGWTFEPWRDNFYPEGWPQSRELEYASRRLSAIEVNGTYYGLQKAATFAKWRDETPDDFVFSLKASRYATNRRVLAEAGESIQRFVDSGITELAHKLGPIVWQFAPTKRFEPEDFEAFLKCLPGKLGDLPLRHALDVRHASFMTPDYLALAHRYRAATVFADSDDYPSFADVTGDFIYCRTMRSDASLAEGYMSAALDQIAACAQVWRDGHEPAGLPQRHRRRGVVQRLPTLGRPHISPRAVPSLGAEATGGHCHLESRAQGQARARRDAGKKLGAEQAHAGPGTPRRRTCRQARGVDAEVALRVMRCIGHQPQVGQFAARPEACRVNGAEGEAGQEDVGRDDPERVLLTADEPRQRLRDSAGRFECATVVAAFGRVADG